MMQDDLNSRQAGEAIAALRPTLVGALAARDGAVGAAPAMPEAALADVDAGDLLDYLAEALVLQHDAVFSDYVAWANVRLASRQAGAAALAGRLQRVAAVLREHLPAELARPAVRVIETALQALPALPAEVPSFLAQGSALAHQYLQALLRGERHVASRLVLGAAERGTPIRQLYLEVFQPAQYELGRLWQVNRISVAQEHYCTAATQLIMSQLYPYLFGTEKNGLTLVATSVAGDLHELGPRMVADFFELAGWDTYYVGANTPHDGVVGTLIERRADVLAVSATIPHHISAVAALIAAVRERPQCAAVRVLVGGHAFSSAADLWRQTGADAYAADADGGIAAAARLVRPAAAA